jgi:hypothetical protein
MSNQLLKAADYKLTFKEIENRTATPHGSIYIVWNSWPPHRYDRRVANMRRGVIISPISVSLEEIS